VTLKTVKAQRITDLAAFYSTGLPGVYAMTHTKKVDGLETPVTGKFAYDPDYEMEGADEPGQAGTVTVRHSEISTVIERDTFTFTPDDADENEPAETWEITGASKSGDGQEWICRVAKR
jgi:hypothetical protein